MTEVHTPLYVAAHRLLDKIAAMEQPMRACIEMSAVHGVPYTGPTWVEELAAVEAALGAKPAATFRPPEEVSRILESLDAAGHTRMRKELAALQSSLTQEFAELSVELEQFVRRYVPTLRKVLKPRVPAVGDALEVQVAAGVLSAVAGRLATLLTPDQVARGIQDMWANFSAVVNVAQSAQALDMARSALDAVVSDSKAPPDAD